jgi:hypothetical protein
VPPESYVVVGLAKTGTTAVAMTLRNTWGDYRAAKSSGLSSIGTPWGVRSAARSQAS